MLSGFLYCGPVDAQSGNFDPTQFESETELFPLGTCCADDTCDANSDATLECFSAGVDGVDVLTAIGKCPTNADFCNATATVTFDAEYPDLYRSRAPGMLPPGSVCLQTISGDCGFPNLGNGNKSANASFLVLAGDITNVPPTDGTTASCVAGDFTVVFVSLNGVSGKERREAS